MISETIIYQYGYKQGLDIINDEIVSWPYSAPKPTPEELDVLVAAYSFYSKAKDYVQKTLESTAQQKGYDTVLSMCSYATSTNLQWKEEAEAFIFWRDTIMLNAVNVFNELLSNPSNVPDFEDFKSQLPTINWP